MLYDFYVGLDLGQAQDYTALVVVEELVWDPREKRGWISRTQLPRGYAKPLKWPKKRWASSFRAGRPPLHVRHLQRFALGTSYPTIVQETRTLLDRQPLRDNSVLVVDATGVGAPVVDLLDRAGLGSVAVNITGGNKVTRGHGSRTMNVPKRDLVSAVKVLLQNGRLKVADELSEASTLKGELGNFRVKITSTAHDTYGVWREGVHDDLVLAVALACWYREWYNAYEGLQW